MLSQKCHPISVFKVSQTRQLLKTESQSLNFGNQTPFDQITHFFSSQIHSKVTPQYQQTMTIHDCMPQERLFRPMCHDYIIMGLLVCLFVSLSVRKSTFIQNWFLLGKYTTFCLPERQNTKTKTVANLDFQHIWDVGISTIV